MTVEASRYLLDTASARTLLRPDAPAALIDTIRSVRSGLLWLSAISEAELRATLQAENAPAVLHQALEILLRNIATVPFDRAAAMAYARWPKHDTPGSALSAQDRLVAAHAVSIDAILVTSNPHYRTLPGLTTEDWCVNR